MVVAYGRDPILLHILGSGNSEPSQDLEYSQTKREKDMRDSLKTSARKAKEPTGLKMGKG